MRQRPLLLLALACYCALTTGYLLRTPVFEGPDENDHLYYAFHLGHTHSLPIVLGSMAATGEPAWKNASLGHHPPLYYALLALTLRGLGLADASPSWTPAPQPPGPLQWRHGADESWPYSTEVRGFLWLRGWSLLCGLGSLLCTWALARRLFPARPAFADAAVLCLACLPQWCFQHGVLDNGNLATLLAHAALLLLVQMLQARRWPLARGLLLGTLLGLGLLTKLTAIFLVPLVGLAWLWQLARAAGRRRETLGAGLLAAAAATAIAGWFFVRNLRIYGDLLGTKAHEIAYAGNRVPEQLLHTTAYWGEVLWRTLHSFCGNFGWLRVPVPEWICWAVLLCMASALLGWLFGRKRVAPELRLEPALFFTTLAIWLVFASVLRFNQKFVQPQGRYLFPAAGPMLLMFGAGLVLCAGRFAPGLCRGWPRALAVACAPVSALYVFAAVFWPGLALPPVDDPLRASLVARIATPAPAAQRTLEALAPADGSRTQAPPAFRFRAPAGADPAARYTIHAWLEDGRILFATHEWIGLALPAGEYALPASHWEQLPTDVPICWKVRRLPDRSRGEASAAMPETPVQHLIRLR